ncbi:MAG: transcriptional repressor [Spirochaetia bacterium]|nr:transcriptional repressor [Spirochaetia bacterium]
MTEKILNINQELDLFRKKVSEKNYRYTPQRDEIAQWIFNEHGHFSAEDIVLQFKNKGKKASQATIYRVIQMMIDMGFLIVHDFDKGQKIYEHTTDHSHHDHFICDKCGKIIEFYDKNLENLKNDIAKRHEFVMDRHSLRIFGTCKNCN